MIRTNHARVHRARGGVERVNGRENPKLRDGAIEHRGGVQMCEGRRGRRVGQVVGGYVDGLHRGDRTLLGGGDTFLQRAHIGGQRRLIAHRRRDAAQQRGHFSAGLRKAEDVINKEQHVLALLITEIFRHGQARKRHAGARARRFIHLAIDQRHLGTFGIAIAKLDDACINHFVIQVITFARALTHTSKHRNAAMALGDVVDQFLNGHCLAHTGAAEKADLAALQVRGQQVNHLNASDKDFRAGRLFVKGRRFAVNRVMHGGGHRAALINRLTDHVQDAAQRARAHRHGDAGARINHFGATHQAVRGVHRDAAHGALTQMLRHFQDELLLSDLQRQRVHDRG